MNVDFSQLQVYANGLKKTQADLDQFLRDFLVEMAFRTIAKTKPRTKWVTGALRNMWQIGYISVNGNNLEVEIINNMEYASFYEFGARNRDGSWRNGRFPVTISLDEINKEMPLRFQQAWTQYLARNGVS